MKILKHTILVAFLLLLSSNLAQSQRPSSCVENTEQAVIAEEAITEAFEEDFYIEGEIGVADEPIIEEQAESDQGPALEEGSVSHAEEAATVADTEGCHLNEQVDRPEEAWPVEPENEEGIVIIEEAVPVEEATNAEAGEVISVEPILAEEGAESAFPAEEAVSVEQTEGGYCNEQGNPTEESVFEEEEEAVTSEENVEMTVPTENGETVPTEELIYEQGEDSEEEVIYEEECIEIIEEEEEVIIEEEVSEPCPQFVEELEVDGFWMTFHPCCVSDNAECDQPSEPVCLETEKCEADHCRKHYETVENGCLACRGHSDLLYSLGRCPWDNNHDQHLHHGN